MNKFKSITKPLGWLMALLLVAFAAGCSSGGDGTAGDTTAPTVSLTAPLNAAIGVALNANITATFSEAMDAATITATTFTLKQGATVVPGAVTYAGTTAVFNPTSNLTASTSYTATVTTGVKDLADNALVATKTWSFTTGTAVDTTAPTVILTVPADGAPSVAVGANIVATFSEDMNPATITATTTFTLMQGTTPIAGEVTFPGTTVATFNPTGDLTAGSLYTATITTAAQDLAGNALAVAKTWNFTAAAVAGPVVCTTGATNCVDLGTAANYVIFGTSGITNASSDTVEIGNLGTAAAASTITGFVKTLDVSGQFSTDPQVIGNIYAVDYAVPTPTVVGTASNDVLAAYTAANAVGGGAGVGAACPGTGDFSGQAIPPGVYACGGVTIPTSFTLAGTGATTDVWVFKLSGTLGMTAGADMTFTGTQGALPQNVFWAVAGAVSIGAGSTLEGVVLGATSIDTLAGSVVHGRLLAQTAVNLNGGTNVVAEP